MALRAIRAIQVNRDVRDIRDIIIIRAIRDIRDIGATTDDEYFDIVYIINIVTSSIINKKITETHL